MIYLSKKTRDYVYYIGIVLIILMWISTSFYFTLGISANSNDDYFSVRFLQTIMIVSFITTISLALYYYWASFYIHIDSLYAEVSIEQVEDLKKLYLETEHQEIIDLILEISKKEKIIISDYKKVYKLKQLIEGFKKQEELNLAIDSFKKAVEG